MRKYLDYNKQFLVNTDASDEGIGAVLNQEDEGNEKVTQYISRSLQPAEKKWCIREKEGLAIIHACESFPPYLYGTKFIVETDHHSLQWLMKAVTPATLWALKLAEYDFIIRYKKGAANSNADALSRLPVAEAQEILNSMEIFDSLMSPNNLLRTIASQIFFEKYDGHKLLVIPRAAIPEILEFYHAHELSIHMSRVRLYALLRKRFYWPSLFKDVIEWVAEFPQCSMVKT